MLKDFLAFIKEYNVVGIAIAFVMGAASNSLAKSLVDDIVMPLLNPLLSGIAWQEAVLQIWPHKSPLGRVPRRAVAFLDLGFCCLYCCEKDC